MAESEKMVRGKKKSRGSSQKSKRPGNSVIKYRQRFKWRGPLWREERQVDNLAMGWEPSHTLFVMVFPVRNSAQCPGRRHKQERIGEATRSRAALPACPASAQPRPTKRDPFNSSLRRSKFSGARNHSCPINLTLVDPLHCKKLPPHTRLMSTCLFDATSTWDNRRHTFLSAITRWGRYSTFYIVSCLG